MNIMQRVIPRNIIRFHPRNYVVGAIYALKEGNVVKFEHTEEGQQHVEIEATVIKQFKSLNQAKQIHTQILVQCLSNSDIINAYISSESPHHALTTLKQITPSPHSVFWWNSIIQRDIRNACPKNAIFLYVDLQKLGWRPDGYTFPYVLKACGELSKIRVGVSVHGSVCVLGFESNVFVCNALIAMYGRCGELQSAKQVFDDMTESGVCDSVSWNSIVASYVQGGKPREGIEIFSKMSDFSGFKSRPDVISLVNILPACGSIGSLKLGKQVHSYAIRSWLCEDVFVGNAVIDMYAKCEMMDEASKVFKGMKVRDVVSWNAMVTGYSQIGRYEDALNLFEQMRLEKIELDVVTWSSVISGYAQRGYGCKSLYVFRQMQINGAKPNVITLVSLLSACASVGALVQGKETHCYALKHILNTRESDLGDDMMVISGLIDMYAKCKSTLFARTIFDSIELNQRNVVTWTVMIGGYAQHGEANDALELFSQMLLQKHHSVSPNAFTIACALMACARLGALRFGKQIHGYVLRKRYDPVMMFVSNCLIDMYSKSGDVDSARIVFDSMHNKNAVSWTSLMTCYGMHGQGEEVLNIFNRMRKDGLVPDGVTFVVLLYACSHSGMVNEGIHFFENMVKEFKVVPGVEHYACMVDLLGRAGRLDEAMKVIKAMPMKPTPIIWIALLSSCRTHANVELGEYAMNQLSELDSLNDGTYTLLSNIYANAKRWKDVARIRTMMKNTGIRKRPGCSWVQGKKATTTFFVGDRSHPDSQKLYEILSDLIERIKPLGYVPEMSFALHDVDEEEKGDLLFEHSEKLALAYGILTTPLGAPIRITKNLRVCGDCHNAMTYISKIVDHEIIVRDSSRFHHFKNGVCSCKGYW